MQVHSEEAQQMAADAEAMAADAETLQLGTERRCWWSSSQMLIV